MMNITSYKKKGGKTFYKLKAYLGLDPKTGKPVEITRQGFVSAKDAQLHYLEELRKFEARTEEGALLPAIRFKELTDMWLPIYEKTVVESTYHLTHGFFKRHILPELGEIYIDKIDAPTLNRAVLKWSETQSKARDMLGYTKRVLDLGVDLGYLKSHPGSKAKAPKKKKKQKKALQFLEREELNHYLQVSKQHLPHAWYVYIRLLAMSGLRRAEALALIGKDLSGEMLAVERTISTGKGYKTYVGLPKTPSSFRTIRLDQKTVNLLKSIIGEPDEPIFRQSDGSYWSLSRPGHYMNQLAKKADVPKITPHVLRHTHCALMFEAGAGLKEVQDRLGHEDIEITLSIYNHVSNRHQHEAIDRLTAYLEGRIFGGNSVQFDKRRLRTLKNARSKAK